MAFGVPGVITGAWGGLTNLFGGGGSKPKYQPLGSGSSPVPNYGTPSPSFEQVFNQFAGMAAPQFAGIDLQQAQQRNQIAQLQAQFQQQSGFAHQNYGLASRGIALDEAGIGIARGANEQDEEYFNRLGAMLSDNYNRQVGEVGQYNTLFNQDYSGKLGYLTTIEELINSMFNYRETGTKNQFADARRDQESDAIARGAVGSSGHGQRLTSLRDQYEVAMGQLGVGRRQEVAGVKEQRRGVDQAYKEGILGIQKQLGDLAYGYNREKLSLWNEQVANDQERAMLDLKAQELGLKRDQLAAQLSQGLQSLGLQNTINVNGLMNAMASGDIQRQILAQQVTQQAMAVAGPPPPSVISNQGGTVKRGKSF